jgi:F0F1-type ATP synthase membrane subunit b/b'
MKPSIAFLLIALLATLALGACGESKEDKAKSIAGSVGKSTSLSEAKAQLTSALQQLGDAYKQSFAKVDC